MEKLENIIFYSLDKSIKTYRQFAQKRFNEAGLDITIDQWLVLQAIIQNPGISQLEIAEKVFKDGASITRIIDLLIQKKFLEREPHEADRRRFHLKVTKEGNDMMNNISKIVKQNRETALKGISEAQLIQLKKALSQIIENCSKKLNT